MSVKLQRFQVFHLRLWPFDIMATKGDFRPYFVKSDNAKVKSSTLKDNPKASYLAHIQSALNITGETGI